MIGVNKILMPNISNHMSYTNSRTTGNYGVTDWNLNGTFEDRILVQLGNFDTLRFALASNNDYGGQVFVRAKHKVTGVDVIIAQSGYWWNSSAGGPYVNLGQYNAGYGYGTVYGVTMANRDFTLQVDTDKIIKWSTPQGLKPLNGHNYEDYIDYYIIVTNNLGNSYNYAVTTVYLDWIYKELEYVSFVDENTANLLETCSKETLNKEILNIKDFTSITNYLEKCVANGVITQTDLDNAKVYDTNITGFLQTVNGNQKTLTAETPILLTPGIVNPELRPYYMIIMMKKTTGYTKGGRVIQLPQYMKFKVGLPTDETADIKLDYINRIDTIDALNLNIKFSNIIKQ